MAESEAVSRFLCKKGRITIPYPMRVQLGWLAGDVLAFTVQEDALAIRRIAPCRCEKPAEKDEITAFVDTLTASQQMTLLVKLSESWAVRQEGCR